MISWAYRFFHAAHVRHRPARDGLCEGQSPPAARVRQVHGAGDIAVIGGANEDPDSTAGGDRVRYVVDTRARRAVPGGRRASFRADAKRVGRDLPQALGIDPTVSAHSCVVESGGDRR
jgi:hypothetical protein